MQNTYFILGMIALSLLGHLLLPWFAVALAGIVMGLLFFMPHWRAMLLGFLGAALLWGCYAGWLNWQNQGILAERMGMLFGGLSGWLLVLVTAILGGAYGSLGALTGSLFRRLI